MNLSGPHLDLHVSVGQLVELGNKTILVFSVGAWGISRDFCLNIFLEGGVFRGTQEGLVWSTQGGTWLGRRGVLRNACEQLFDSQVGVPYLLP